jgi:hypothetical protein
VRIRRTLSGDISTSLANAMHEILYITSRTDFSGSWFRASTITIANKIQQDAPVLKSFKKTPLFYPILLYMFRALLCQSSGAPILPAFAASGLPCGVNRRLRMQEE